MYPFELPALPYAYDALEPYIDAATMHLHHDRHLAAYVEGLNKALSGCPRLQTLDLKQLICTAGRYPDHVRVPILRNAGGVFNHEFFFSSLTPETDQCPSGALKQALERDFGHPAAFQRQMTDAAMSVFGSGYAWLVSCKGRLRIVTTCNQNTPAAGHATYSEYRRVGTCLLPANTKPSQKLSRIIIPRIKLVRSCNAISPLHGLTCLDSVSPIT